MSWQTLDTTPIFAGCMVPPARAAAVRAALQKRIVPLLVTRQCRLEPLATGALCTDSGRTFLLTCRHALDDGVALDDLAVPLVDSRVLWLRHAHPRAFVHPLHDLALIELRGGVARSLAQHYRAVPLAADDIDERGESSAKSNDARQIKAIWPASSRTSGSHGARGARIGVLAGFPYAQMRRVDGVLYARPLVAFVSLRTDLSTTPSNGSSSDRLMSSNIAEKFPIDRADRNGAAAGERDVARNPSADVFIAYPRIAVRADGVEINAPELDGLSGATLWTVHDESADGIGCVLRASGVQVAFKPGAYARAEPLAALRDLLEHVRA
jgi:hypothetical protein